MKNQFSYIVMILLLTTMYSCKKDDLDICNGVEKKDVISNIRTIDYGGYHLMDRFVKPIIQDNFIFFNIISPNKEKVILKVDFDTYEINNDIAGSMSNNLGFHDNNYYFSKTAIVSGEVYYIDLRTMERKHIIVDSDKTKPFIHNEIFDKNYVIYYNLKEQTETNNVYEIFKFIPNTTDPELIGEFTTEKYEAVDIVFRSMKLWNSNDGDMMLTFSFTSYASGVKDYISSYNISTNKLLFYKTLSIEKNETEELIEYPKSHFQNDKIIVSASGGIILIYDIISGEQIWKYFLDFIDQDNLYIDEETSLVYVGQYQEIVQIDLKTGKKEQVIDSGNPKVYDIENGSLQQLLMIPFQNSIAYVLNKDDKNTLELSTKTDLCQIDKVNLNGPVKYIFKIKKSKKILLVEDNKIEVINYEF